MKPGDICTSSYEHTKIDVETCNAFRNMKPGDIYVYHHTNMPGAPRKLVMLLEKATYHHVQNGNGWLVYNRESGRIGYIHNDFLISNAETF